MNSASVDLIYLDPPFNSKANYAAPIGSKAAGAAFKDTWKLTDIYVEWINLIEAKHPALYRVLLAAITKSDKSYLVYMAPSYPRNKKVTQTYWEYLPALRYENVTLYQAGYGCHLWQKTLQKRDRVVLPKMVNCEWTICEKPRCYSHVRARRADIQYPVCWFSTRNHEALERKASAGHIFRRRDTAGNLNGQGQRRKPMS